MACFQVGSFLDPALIGETFSNLGQVFPSVVKIRLTMPSYHCGEYCFMGASKDIVLENISMEHIEKRFKEVIVSTTEEHNIEKSNNKNRQEFKNTKHGGRCRC